MRLVTFISAMGLLAASSGPSLAQSAEDAAIYVLTGIEAGTAVEIGDKDVIWQRARGSRTTFTAEGKKGDDRLVMTATAKRISDCSFEIAIVADLGERKAVETVDIKADFTRIDGLSVRNDELHFSGEGICVTDAFERECQKEVIGFAKAPDATKLGLGFAKLRETTCKP